MQRKSERTFLEAAGVLLALFGAFLLVFGGLLPLINSGFARLHDDDGFSTGNLFAILMSGVILCLAILCSRSASKLKRGDDENSKR